MGLKIVIVDDAPFIREAIRNITEGEGMEVVAEAADGLQAVEAVKKFSPDVVILDLVLPRQNGIDTAKEILSARPGTAILACSTESQKDMLLKALEAGCKDFLPKPFEKDALLGKLRKLSAEDA